MGNICDEKKKNMYRYIALDIILKNIFSLSRHSLCLLRNGLLDKIWIVSNIKWFGMVSLFNGISTFAGYLMPKVFSEKNSSGTI